MTVYEELSKDAEIAALKERVRELEWIIMTIKEALKEVK